MMTQKEHKKLKRLSNSPDYHTGIQHHRKYINDRIKELEEKYHINKKLPIGEIAEALIVLNDIKQLNK